MIRLVGFLLAILLIASGLAWLADRPGMVVLNWQGYEIETSLFRAIVILSLLIAGGLLLWQAVRTIWLSPALLGRYMRKQRQRKGLDALASGMIAVSAGDRNAANKFTQQARKSLPNEPLTHLLRAQTAQLTGDRTTAKRIYESMLSSTDTEQLGLRGLFLEATEMNEPEAARHFASRALAANPGLAWPVDATFKHQCQEENWVGALETLATARRFGHVDKPAADRKRAVLLTAQAQRLEDRRPDEALALALEAHGLAKNLVPAAAIAGRLLASKGNTGRAAKVLQKTWVRSPHPDLATAYAYARIGDSPNDRLERIKKLAATAEKSVEGPIAVAVAALEARDFDVARHALAPFLEDRLTQRVATLMARIENEQHGDKGRVREWLARAVTAGRDPVWTADGMISDHWAPVSPVSGELDAFAWRIPVERAPGQSTQNITAKAEELITVLAAAQNQPTLDTRPTDTSPGPGVTSTKPKTNAGPIVISADDPTPHASDVTRQSTGGVDRDQPSTPATTTPDQSNSDDTIPARTASYTAKSGHKKKKKFQHPHASVAIKSDKSGDDTQKTETKSGAKMDQPKRDEAEPIAVPRAPDDPGPDLDDQDLSNPIFKPYRTVSS